MAEARSAVSYIRVPPNLEEGRDTWKDVLNAVRKAAKRRYYRTRNSIRNGTWPTSTNNLAVAFLLLLLWMLADPPPPRLLVRMLPLPSGCPVLIQAVFLASLLSVIFFLVLMTLRQLLLRLLLSYHGWMYVQPRKTPMRVRLWGLLVKLVSGYQPSLFSCQRSLPRMSVPPLKQTFEKLLESLEPICSPEKLEELRTQAKNFEETLGPKLQRVLVLKSWWSQNYVSDWWEKFVYLSGRRSLAINSNFYGMDQSYWQPTHRQASRAALTLHLAVNFKRLIDREELPPLLVRGTIPLCMAQYEKFFSTVRRPGEEVDSLVHYDASESRHAVVQCRGLYYQVEMFDSRNQLLGPVALEEQMDWILKHSAEHATSVSEEARKIAALTALPRTEWYEIMSKHFISGVNSESLATVEKAICMVVLSEESPTDLTAQGNWLLHGDPGSFWFDKSMTLVTFANARCGINAEHTRADAPVAGHCMEYIYTKEVIDRLYTEEGKCMPQPRPFRQAKVKSPTWILWDVSPELGTHVNHAVTFSKQNNDDLDLIVADHDSWGKGVIKKLGVSPDAFMQLAMLLAYCRDSQGRLPLTYEASMTRLFHCGRTETVRSCTPQAAAFVKSMNEDSTASREERANLLREAAARHQDLYREAMCGEAPDRHLFAMYVACRGLGHKSPFLEEILSLPWTLSTSQQPQQQIAEMPDVNHEIFMNKVSPGGGFGPVSDDGYGVSYMLPSDHRLFFHVSSKKSSKFTNSARFVAHINQAMEDMRNTLSSS